MGRGEDTRARILDRAMEMASIDGLQGLTIGRLSADLKLSKSGLFAHFGSKEKLQQAVLQETEERFVKEVLIPAFKKPRGEPRILAVMDNWMKWISRSDVSGGCLLIGSAIELDDKPGPTRDHLVTSQKRFLKGMARSAKIAVEEGHFRADLEPEQFAFELFSIVLGFHHASRLVQDKKAKARAKMAVNRLLESARKS